MPGTASRSAETPSLSTVQATLPPPRTHLHVCVSVRRACGTHTEDRARGRGRVQAQTCAAGVLGGARIPLETQTDRYGDT